MSKGFGAPTIFPPSVTIKTLKGSVIKEFERLDEPWVKPQPQH